MLSSFVTVHAGFGRVGVRRPLIVSVERPVKVAWYSLRPEVRTTSPPAILTSPTVVIPILDTARVQSNSAFDVPSSIPSASHNQRLIRNDVACIGHSILSDLSLCVCEPSAHRPHVQLRTGCTG